MELKKYIEECHKTAKSKMFSKEGIQRPFHMLMALLVTEIAEAIEADRNLDKEEWIEIKLSKDEYAYLLANLNTELANFVTNKAKTINPKENRIEELCDLFIRLMDTIGEMDWQDKFLDVLHKKMEYNKTRPMMHGGKRY